MWAVLAWLSILAHHNPGVAPEQEGLGSKLAKAAPGAPPFHINIICSDA